MKRLIRWVGAAFVVLIVIGAIGAIFSSKKKTATPTAPQTTATLAAPQQTSATSQASQSNPCAKITLTAHTSCPFAQAVIKAYDAAPSRTIQAYSPVTHVTYTMRCFQAQGVVSCSGGNNAGVAFGGPPIPGVASATATATSSSQSVEGPGSSDHATDAQFCSAHQCIPNFANGNGSIVQCVDGEWSHSGALSGACSHHGGES